MDERWKFVVNRILYSKHYQRFYIVILICSFTLLFQTLSHKCPSFWQYLLESLVLLSMTLEISLRLLVVPLDCWMIIDGAVLLICLIDFGFQLTGCHQLEQLLEQFLLIVRNSVQLVRLVLFIRKRPQLSRRIGDLEQYQHTVLLPDIDVEYEETE
ncbi:hypothetical protein EDD86DRAFT_74327 [Gorgonomyces haynaldii]|nr:hypothetical protein EDD86DRAFT_74327 [Gorgonomyces haynaldii]